MPFNKKKTYLFSFGNRKIIFPKHKNNKENRSKKKIFTF